MGIFNRACFVFLSLLSLTQVYSLEQILIDQKNSILSIGEYVEFYEDKEQNIDFSSIKESKENWNESKRESLLFGFTQSKYWIRFRIKNNTTEKQLLVLDTNSSRIDLIEFYNPDTKGVYRKIVTGDTFPYSQRDIDHYNFAFKIELEPEEEKTIFIAVSGKYSVTNLTPKLLRLEFFYKESKEDILFLGIFYGFLFVMILYNLALFSRVKELAYLYLGAFISFYLLYFLGFQGIGFQYLYSNSPWIQNRDFHISTPFIFLFSSLFANEFLDLKRNLYKGYLANWFIVWAMLVWFVLNHLFVFNLYPTFSFFVASRSIVLGVFVALFNGVYLVFKKNRSAYFYLGSWIVLLIANMIRFLEVTHIIPANQFTIYLVQIGLGSIVILLSFGLADKMNLLKEELQKSKEDLEVKVLERTKELKDTLTEVNLLKEKQDGDFFLASLLVEPLAVNKIETGTVLVDFFIKQKKEFYFKSQELRSIGGDICTAYSIKLRNRKYTTFLNGDAMGKSMQGSSGALILGSLFGSIVNRNKFSPLNQDMTPEQWMRSAFLEMHRVFEVFDFSMLVSIAFGLIENQTGTLFYINADHPQTVLYRDGRASFFEKNMRMPKLGTLGMTESISVQTFSLKDGDILIAGSDGRDDLLDEKTGDMKWDESRFLNYVEKGKGNLEEIYELISLSGTIIDDLSLLKVSFRLHADNKD
ncbi:MAG TPA: 7TM diverse intracellular signaling domain-containing protein [Leptospiraceae bacterium]|nr:7TM diverse intracellular signaling domain-containing protein [Leptospiraceae bacterium]HMW08448.1 7TM diverse intracellular signaling domain-containing protein [Leptospiraceae bacterium]HMX34717.1 7TM diverse intracellular signaling domain-containing protein [Leptospiraceae bacterium]HMY34275.1 7TM diverse intracellular signaling domain-containing protein [Leptospiraceae bacterium]HNA10022.1 7TM diverse intracellular signaling domain-containing protein [Leptospiraceae bacterium]